jgi:VanZ family protein
LSSIFKDSSVRFAFTLVGLLLIPLLVYASILPLVYVPLDWQKAVSSWKSTPWFNLGVGKRADWIANALVVMPITFMLSGACGYRRNWSLGLFAWFSVIMAMMSAVVVGIECLQVWFPRRTRSLNDILAGCAGAFLGTFTWVAIGGRTTDYVLRFLSLETLRQRLLWLAIGACIACVLYSLYPFDFVLSINEFRLKIDKGRIGFLNAGTDWKSIENIKGFVTSVIRLLPFGVALGLSPRWPNRFLSIVVISLLLEMMQIPVYSKYSTALDWISGILGGYLGLLAVRSVSFWEHIRGKSWLWVLLMVSWILVIYGVYVGILPFGFGRNVIKDDALLSHRWRNSISPPFLKYYFSSEYEAVTNLLGKAISFGILGVLTEALIESLPSKNGSRPIWTAGLAMAFMAILVEISQIYVEGQIADTTDVLIYIFGGMAGLLLLRHVLHGIPVLRQELPVSENQIGVKIDLDPDSKLQMVSWFRGAMGIGLLIAGGLLSLGHPGWPFTQLLIVLCMSLSVYSRPDLFPLVFVVGLVIGDAYLWTGQLTVQEYDSVLAGSLGGCLLGSGGLVNSKLQDSRIATPLEWLGRIGWTSMLLSVLIGLGIGLYRLPQVPFGDQLSVYFTGWNAVRVVKGFLWGFAFYGVLRLLGPRTLDQWRMRFIQGFLLAAWYVGIWVLMERAVFPGITNIADIYRATGPFFTMHIGDQHIDGFLVLAFPIAVGWTLEKVQRDVGLSVAARSLFGILAVLFVCHAVFATMSRGTILAIGFQSVILLLTSTLRFHQGISKLDFSRFALVAIPIAGLFFLVAYSVLLSRFDSSVEDTKGRFAHWSRIVRAGTTGPGGISIGHGIGSFPSMMASERAIGFPPVRWQSDGRNGRIEILSGWPLYLERYAMEIPGSMVRTSYGVRLESIDAQESTTSLYRVEKSLLQSYGSGTVGLTLAVEKPQEVLWPEKMVRETTDRNPFSEFRPVFVGISPPSDGGLIVENQEASSELISATSSYPWVFTCDDHLIWRAKNFLVHAYYEQGLLGVIAWLLLVLYSTLRGYQAIVSHKQEDQAVLWISLSLLGFWIVGMFGTLVDTPWLTALVLSCVALLGGSFRFDQPGKTTDA